MKNGSSYIKDIIYFLKKLNYQFENWNENWVENVLTNECSSRNNLLLWSLQQLGLFRGISFFSVEFSTKRIHKELLLIGICKSSDINIIEASVNPGIQLKFWKYLLEIILDLKFNFNNKKDKFFAQKSDNLLDNLMSSSNFQELRLKEEDISLLPADLKKHYNIWKKESKEDLSCHFVQTEKLFLDLKDLNSDDQIIVDECSIENLCHSLRSLHKQADLMQEIFESSFGPWCHQACISSSVVSNVLGNNVNRNESHLTMLMRTLKLEEKIGCSLKDIETKVVHFNRCNIKHGSIEVLDNISMVIKKLANL